MFEGWPNHHQALRKKVAKAISIQPNNTTICALEGYYLPHGGKDEMWMVLTPSGGTISRIRSPYRGKAISVARSLNGDESSAISNDLERLGAWNLSHFKQPVMDGWPCAIALAEGKRLHSIQTHNPVGKHLQLIEYILELLPIP
jgi:hypothetical protein